ncbi:aminopeptidase P family protein [Polymorphobacter sp. PAMC 29334]|uniref:aminopeptidase P family protein n=1 Tax=Polymorphobacter sp. PAMC 29334 TaxID=2862331 RepID=UPI001C6815BB|nr:aminopeptidase P family protein [Polymorphobacter sp. PAMC 29334]QYE35194.1 aminopeptidase P family protein [Polymorphobacter sp. PAMC 29334]
MSTPAARLAALREQLAADRLTGFVVPLTDEHMSEYVGAYAQRLAWLTGFGGSAGSAVVLADKAAMFTDGRYTLQVRAQVDGGLYDYVAVPATSATDWLAANARPGDRVGYDAWLHTRGWVAATGKALGEHGATLVAVPANPIDAVWTDRPVPSTARLEVHPDEFAGETSDSKRGRIAAWLDTKHADAVVVSALDSIAWLFNVRGKDVEHTPVPLAFALVHADASADLFVDAAKLSPDVRAHLGEHVRIHDRGAFGTALEGLGGRTVVVDPTSAVAAIFAHLDAGAATIIEARDPCVVPKAVKNPVEIAGSKAAHLRDGAALTRFLHWFAGEAPKGELDEMSSAAKLRQFRDQTNQLEDLSFDTISAAGPNGALPHYRVSAESSRPIEIDSLYLVDSGGQYRDGTTDVTRTLAVGTPTPEMRDRFTRVLKGHIALASAVFPHGTRGNQIDALARQFLWSVGLDYAHGTGHGVGSYLAVHEGPARIATAAGGYGAMGDEALRPGMIMSNEPGYYKAGEYGIRIENLVLVEERAIEGAEKPMLGFETLTLAPLDRALIDISLLTPAERGWVDAYHARVAAALGPLLDDTARIWLDEGTRPLETA